ncbi:MAG: hypothetical protein Q8S04_08290 [Bacteroidales bacterium]|nr:hypothetical protein [Bacteroidales bacterium]
MGYGFAAQIKSTSGDSLMEMNESSKPIPQDKNNPELPDKRVIEFIEEHHLVTLTAGDGTDMWSWHAFYHFSPKEMLFVITSEDKTRHIQIFRRGASNIVSGAIGLETETIGLIRGVQFRATMEQCEGPFLNNYRLSYLKRFPYAILKGGDLWLIKICELKFTDNRLGFGKKIIWKRH